jgi:uncharacterized membrane protein
MTMQKHWLTRPETIRRLWIAFIVVLALVVLAEFGVAGDPHFAVERVFGFNAWYGFIACAVLIVGAKAIGLLLKRPDTYYDASGDDA